MLSPGLQGCFFLCCFCVGLSSMEPVELSADRNVNRRINIILFQVDVLKNIIANKQRAIRELGSCADFGRAKSDMLLQGGASNASVKLGVADLRKVLKDITFWTEKQRDFAREIREKISKLFPSQININPGGGDSVEMFESLKRIFRSPPSNVDLGKMSQNPASCNVESFEPIVQPQLSDQLNTSASEDDICYRGNALLLPTGNYVFYTQNQIRYCSADDKIIWKKRQKHELLSMVYWKDNLVFFEYFGEEYLFKTVKVIDVVTRKSKIQMRYTGGYTTEGLSVAGGFIFSMDRSGIVSVSNGVHYGVRLSWTFGARHYKSVHFIKAEIGSSYMCFLGEILNNRIVLVRPSGEIRCYINHHDLYHSNTGYVTKYGNVYLPSRERNKVYQFGNDCKASGVTVELPRGAYVSDLYGYNDTLIVKTYNSDYAKPPQTYIYTVRPVHRVPQSG